MIIILMIVIIILVVDYHGWTRSADISMDLVPWAQLADTEAGGRRRTTIRLSLCLVTSSGFIFIAMDGMSDVVGGGDYGSWNVSKTEGPLGLTCDPQLVGVVL